MLVEIGVIVASIIPVMLIAKRLTIRISRNSTILALAQMSLGLALGAVVTAVTTLSPYLIIGTTVGPLLINLIMLADKRRQRSKALNGEYGEESMWASELVDEGDDMFAAAVNALPENELREIGIIAESKEELRTLTIERLDELTNTELPDEFK